MLFRKNRNTQIQVYTIQHLELETCEEDHRSCHQVPVASIAVINLLILKNM